MLFLSLNVYHLILTKFKIVLCFKYLLFIEICFFVANISIESEFFYVLLLWIIAHNAVVTAAVFAPNPSHILKQLENQMEEEAPSTSVEHTSYVMVSADFNGTIKVFLHKSKSGVSAAS